MDDNKNILTDKFDFSEITKNNLSASCYVEFYFHKGPKFNTDINNDLEWSDEKNNFILNAIDLIKKILKGNLYVYYFPEASYKDNVCRIYTEKKENGGEFIMEI